LQRLDATPDAALKRALRKSLVQAWTAATFDPDQVARLNASLRALVRQTHPPRPHKGYVVTPAIRATMSAAAKRRWAHRRAKNLAG
jgi:hypothetical protein